MRQPRFFVIPVALERGRTVQLQLPPDLTQAEADKVSAVAQAYVDREGVFSAPRPSWEDYAASVALDR